MAADKEEIKELLDKSYDEIVEIKEKTKAYRGTLKDIAKEVNCEKNAIGRVAEILRTQGVDWYSPTKPLEVTEDKSGETPDRLSRIFRQLKEDIHALGALDRLEILKPYLDALTEYGIHLEIDEDVIYSQVHRASRYVEDTEFNPVNDAKHEIIERNKIISNDHAVTADTLNVIPKPEYRNLVKLYEGILDGSDKVEDMFQNKINTAILVQEAWNVVKENSWDDE